MPFTFNYEDNMYPATDFNQINLDWILQLAQQLKETAESGGFDGAPGEPGTATNGIAFIEVSDTFSDITDAISAGSYPILKHTINGIPVYMPLVSANSVRYKFCTYLDGNFYLYTWNSADTKTVILSVYANKNNPVLTGNALVTTTPPATDSSTKIANTQFVQNAVSVAVQAAIEQLVIAPFSEAFKQALLQLARKVAYIDGQGQTYYQALYDALYPPINVDSITAVWNPPVGYVVYTTTPIDSLKTYLTVTATYDDQTTAVLDADEYVLSGVLTAGTSVITVTYASATTTFNVTVSANVVESISATFTQGSAVIYDTDPLSTLVPYLTVTATYTNLNTVYVDYPDYSLSGTLTEGTSTITVSYEGKSDTFNVTVSAWSITWDYTDGGLPAAVDPTNWSWTDSGGSNHTVTYVANKGIHWVGKSGYIQAAPVGHTTESSGVSEVVINFESINSISNFVIRLSDGTDGVQVSVRQAGVLMFTNNATPISGVTITTGTDYTFRTEYSSTTVNVYMNGNLIYNGVPSTSIPSKVNQFMISTTASGSNYTMNVKAMRFKF